MPDYSKSKIYKLVCDDPELIYYGSTLQPLYKRLNGHKRSYQSKTRDTSSETLFKIGGVKIILVEEFSCDNKEQMFKKEREYIEGNKCVNIRIPSRTVEEWYKTNPESLKNAKAKYYNANKEKILAELKIKNDTMVTCECGVTLKKGSLYYHKKSKKHLKNLNSNTSMVY